MRAFWNRVSMEWCRTFHPDPSWPVHGHYHCPACSRIYPVPWPEGNDFARRENRGTDVAEPHSGFAAFEFQKDRG